MTNKSDIFVYNFIETYTGRTLGTMKVRANQVELRSAPAGAWTSTRELDDILEGGIEKGLSFAFPDQGAPEPSHGINVNSHAMYDAPYGSLDGKTLNLGAINGLMEGFDRNNQLMVLTFRPYVYDYPGYPSSATTMRNNAKKGGTGVFQNSTDPQSHGDKYIYFGTWVRVDD